MPHNYNSNWDWSQPLSINNTSIDNILERTVSVVLQKRKARQRQTQSSDPNTVISDLKNALIHQILNWATAEGTKHQLPYLKDMTLLQLLHYAAIHYPDLAA